MGNYLRAEICERARIPPFVSLREALYRCQHVPPPVAATGHGTAEADLLTVVRQVLRQAVVDKVSIAGHRMSNPHSLQRP